MLDLRSLVEHHLSESPDVFQLLGFYSEVLSQSGDVFSLLFNNLLMLVFQKLLFFFEVIHNLLERLLQHFDLIFQNLYFLLLLQASVFILVGRFLLDQNISLLGFSLSVKLGFLPLIIIKSIPLGHSLLRQLLILVVYIPLNLLNIPLSILLSLKLGLIKALLKFSLFLLLHPSQFNFNQIFLFLISSFE